MCTKKSIALSPLTKELPQVRFGNVGSGLDSLGLDWFPWGRGRRVYEILPARRITHAINRTLPYVISAKVEATSVEELEVALLVDCMANKPALVVFPYICHD